MGKKSLFQRLTSFEGEVAGHVRKLWKKEEDAAEAWTDIVHEGRKLLYRAKKGEPDHARKEAIHYVKKGMENYNQGVMERAETMFRRALKCDAGYARAHFYLGNALYKRGHFTEAVTHWTRATEVEPQSDAAANARERLQHVSLDTAKHVSRQEVVRER